jgi:hypothetical protein
VVQALGDTMRVVPMDQLRALAPALSFEDR